MAYTTINKSSEHFNTKLYTGNGSTNAITGVGFQPDMTWIKIRTQSYSHRIYDAVRGATKYCHPDTTEEQYTTATSLTAFNSDGFTLGSNAGDNKSGDTFASWNWKANGAGSANTDGGINSTVSVNNTAGFSIVKYGTGTGSATTVGHGLNAKPNFIIVKPLGTITTGGWIVGGDNIDSTYNEVSELNETAAKANDPSFNDTAPTSSVFSVGNNNTNRSGENYIAYCFVEKTGYSKFGSLTGNGSTDGTFVYCGFAPSFIMVKAKTSGNWFMYDNKRPGYNNVQQFLEADGNATEYTSNANHSIDILSNGFKFTGGSGSNTSGRENFFMAFGQSLVGSNNVPCTAR
jgi:hypothetical protein|tara:strand:+ start:25 stop:1062 length:1038 start_codon:yes stop_codon:yes gene_type:complete